jgi:hypothetical protein
MSFIGEFEGLALDSLRAEAQESTAADAADSLNKATLSLRDFARLISRRRAAFWRRWAGAPGADPAALRQSDPLFRAALPLQRMHQQLPVLRFLARQSHPAPHFERAGGAGRGARLRRAGFSQHSARRGRASQIRFRLLPGGMRARVARGNAGHFLELGPMDTGQYRTLAGAGADGLVVYQETYDRALYARMHTAGPKRDFNWRLETPERGLRGGIPAAGHRRALRAGGVEAGGAECGGARVVFAAPLLEGAIDHFPAAPAPMCAGNSSR